MCRRLGGDLYVVLSVARTNVEDTLFEAVRVAQKLGLKLDGFTRSHHRRRRAAGEAARESF